MDPAPRLAENLRQVRERMAAAAQRSGRSPDAVLLVAVTKYADQRLAGLLHAAGCRDLGESRPQELWAKAEQLPDTVRWHMIGHLQTNKVARTLRYAHMIHSVDSVKLLEALDRASLRENVCPAILLEVHIADESTKSGFAPAELPRVIDQAGQFRQLRIMGLMGMASHTGDLDRVRREFSGLRQLRDQLRWHCPENVTLAELSMGMSDDFELAIEEGATMVRVGSALFAA